MPSSGAGSMKHGELAGVHFHRIPSSPLSRLLLAGRIEATDRWNKEGQTRKEGGLPQHLINECMI